MLGLRISLNIPLIFIREEDMYLKVLILTRFNNVHVK